MRVLVVDDHRLMSDGVTSLLASHGIEVLGVATDGLEAIALVQELCPDVILMDIRMPRCDGLSATRQIKALWPEIKIVMLTTSAEDQDLFEINEREPRRTAANVIHQQRDALRVIDHRHTPSTARLTQGRLASLPLQERELYEAGNAVTIRGSRKSVKVIYTSQR